MNKTVQIKKINVNKWRISHGDNMYLISYTAKWCKPCQKIKPMLLDLMSSREHVGSKEFNKDHRPEHVKFIPWFDVIDSHGKIVKSIQTSKDDELIKFVEPYSFNKKFILDDDF